jgi:hypothetical protein
VTQGIARDLGLQRGSERDLGRMHPGEFGSVPTFDLAELYGHPLAPGEYEIIVTARESDREVFDAQPLTVLVEHGQVHTLPHITSLPLYPDQPELVSPPRDWRPLALTV